MKIIKIFQNRFHGLLSKREIKKFENAGWIVFRKFSLSNLQKKRTKRKVNHNMPCSITPIGGFNEQDHALVHHIHEKHCERPVKRKLNKTMKGASHLSDEITFGDFNEDIFLKNKTKKLPANNKNPFPFRKRKIPSQELYYKSLMEKIYNTSPYFRKHKYGSRAYERSVTFLKKELERTSEEKIISAFTLAATFFNDWNLKFTPMKMKKNNQKIGVDEFFEFSQYSDYLKKISGVNSLYKVFYKGTAEVYAKLYKIPVDNFPKRTEEFKKQYMKYMQKTELSAHEETNLIKFTEKIDKWCQYFNITTHTGESDWHVVLHALENKWYLKGKKFLNYSFIISEKFFEFIQEFVRENYPDIGKRIDEKIRKVKNENKRNELGMSKRDFMLYEKGIIDERGNPT